MKNAQRLDSHSETRDDDSRLEWVKPTIQSLTEDKVETGALPAYEYTYTSVASLS